MGDGPNAKRRRRDVYRGPNTLTGLQWEFLKRKYDYCCAYCGASGELERDHVIPISKGGTHTVDNVVPACSRCNRQKGDKLVSEWLAERQRIRVRNQSRRQKRRERKERLETMTHD